jgi:ADP-ribose pyrophosphatase YjhB (NUDIX family)
MNARILSLLYQLRLAYRRITNPLTLGVRCLVVRTDGHVLLVRHTYVPGWYLPGGGVDKGETLEAAVLRELREEVGVTSRERPQLFHAYSNFREHKSDHIVLYVLKSFDMAPAHSAEIAEHGFFDPAAPPRDTTSGTLRRLAEWREQQLPGAQW